MKTKQNIAYFFKDNQKPQNPILFVHGFWSSYKISLPLTHLVNDHDFYAIDLPGHGDSVGQNPLNFSDLVSATIEFIETKNLKNISLMCHSMGGGVVAALYPKISHLIKNITFISPLIPDNQIDHAQWKKYFFAQTFEQFQQLFKILYANGAKALTNPTFLKGLEKHFQSRHHDFVPMEQLYDSIFEPNNWKMILQGYKTNQVPNLLIAGKQDIICKPDILQQFFQNNVKNFQYHELDHVAHVAIFEDPETVYKLFKEFNSWNQNYNQIIID
ncbi:Alpha/beta hydrolase [[Mycoplasma] cavipharyngis]|uniref:alpha/beta fold hydrolase n=1 Tax=[Mycoplasma] cavipharyngis TaxID=92757 RepID=UPI003703ACB1